MNLSIQDEVTILFLFTLWMHHYFYSIGCWHYRSTIMISLRGFYSLIVKTNRNCFQFIRVFFFWTKQTTKRFHLIIDHVFGGRGELLVTFDDLIHPITRGIHTLSTALRKSFSLIAFLRSRIANKPTPSAGKAPHTSLCTNRTNFSTCSVRTKTSQQLESTTSPIIQSPYRMPLSRLMLRVWILKMCVRPARSGRPNSIYCLGN